MQMFSIFVSQRVQRVAAMDGLLITHKGPPVLLHWGPFLFMTYAEKLKDPRWQKKRLEILQQHDFTCQHCRDKSTTLHVHHIFYRPKADPWDYTNDALVTLCEKCHSIESLPLTELQRFLWITIVCTCAESSIIQDARDRIINVHANSVNHG